MRRAGALRVGIILLAIAWIVGAIPRALGAKPEGEAPRPQVFKIATLAPQGSVWHRGLQEMAETWKRETGGLIEMKIYAGGIAGDETDMVRKLKSGQLQGAALSAVGLRDLDFAPQLLTLPGLLRTQEEWGYVFSRAIPELDRRLAQKGAVVLTWADTGWIYLFVKRPVRSLAELNGLKIFTWTGDPGAAQAWRIAGFEPVVASVNDLPLSLSTGMVEGFAVTPIIALLAHWYEKAPYMVEIPWGHLPGATVLSSAAWGKVPEALRPRLMELTRRLGEKVDREAQRQYAEALQQMKKHGLTIVRFSEAEQEEWTRRAESAWGALMGEPGAKTIVDGWVVWRDAFRAQTARSTP